MLTIGVMPELAPWVWHNALTLAERALRPSDRVVGHHEGSPTPGEEHTLATRLLTRWKAQTPFDQVGYFDRRLALSGLTSEEFEAIICKSFNQQDARILPEPEWLCDIQAAFGERSAKREAFSTDSKPAIDKRVRGILVLTEPLIVRGKARLASFFEGMDVPAGIERPNHEQIFQLFLPSLESDLLRLINRTIVLELNIASLQGDLAGATERERFQTFLWKLNDPVFAFSILQEYPVLARLIATTITQWVGSVSEFVCRLLADTPAIRSAFSIEPNLRTIRVINTSAGDKHRGGRCVFIITFESGDRLVYKPKSVDVDVCFQKLLDWLNGIGVKPGYRPLNILPRDNYGWMEFIEARACRSVEGVERFYQRQGGYLALLYALGGIDIHYENLIAAGEFPMLIDLETLFKPQIHARKESASADVLAIDALNNSVIATGLLPQRIFGTNQWADLDLSGMGFRDGQLSPYAAPRLDCVGTDEMRVHRQSMPVRGTANQPSIGEEKIGVDGHLDAVISGFRAVYDVLLKHRSNLLGNSGPLSVFRQVTIRIVLRSTRNYALLLLESLHPSLLQNALHRDCFFDHLWQQVSHQPYLERVVAYEHGDLLRGDIPLFTTKTTSHDLLTSSGDAIADFFGISGWTSVQNRIVALSNDDAERQIWLIRASLAERLAAVRKRPDEGWLIGVEGQMSIDLARPVDPIRAVDAAILVGRRIAALAIHGADDVTWIQLTSTSNRRWVAAQLGMDLYEGIPGISLFLAYLGAISGQEAFSSLAKKASVTLLRQVEAGASKVKTIGLFNGWGGVVYTLVHLGVLWGRADLIDKAVDIVSSLRLLVAEDRSLDVIGGSAGSILGLAAAYRVIPSPRLVDIAQLCGRRLMQEAISVDGGKGWRTSISSSAPLTGFSHGAGGIAFALCRMSDLTGKDQAIELARDAIRYERGLFSQHRRNWPDLRTTIDDGGASDGANVNITSSEKAYPDHSDHLDLNSLPHPAFWCHGASGIALSRIGMLDYVDDPETLTEIETGCATTMREGFRQNHSLCHGSMGNLDLLLRAQSQLGITTWNQEVGYIINSILSDIEAGAWRSGHPKGVESLGLMTGLAGIGLGLLRLAYPQRVPSVLLADPPCETH